MASTLLTDLLVIIGGAISGIVGLLIERQRGKKERRIRHLEEIKQNCLIPLKERLEEVRARFRFAESYPDLEQLTDLERTPTDWWLFHPLEENISSEAKVDKVLYSDLPNHAPELSNELGSLQMALHKDAEGLFSEISNQIDRVPSTLSAYSVSGFLSAEEKVILAGFRPEWQQRLQLGILRLASNKGELNKRQTLAFLTESILTKEVTEMLAKIATEQSASKEWVSVSQRLADFDQRFSKCLALIENAIHLTQLPGECEYA